MASEEHLKILKQGVEAWNEWREKNLQIIPDLSKADLYEADLYEADLYEADLTGANLNGAQDLTAKQLIITINWQELGFAFLTQFNQT